MATNDELIRKVATTIKQYVFSATIEEALDAAKAVLAGVLKGHAENDYAVIMLGEKMEAIRKIAQVGSPDIQSVVNNLVEIKMVHHSALTGEDYTVISTEPLIVTEEIEPEAKG